MSVFTGNVNKLVSAAMLQDFLIDKDGTPMSGGTITMYHDNSRTTLKNWYYQSGTPGNYTYITLPNPLTLSAAGTICDINGVDTIPFYYPWSETDENVPDPYYVTIVNYAMTNQITRANFPFGGSGGGPIPPTPPVTNTNNLVSNNGFWRNIQPNNVNITPFVSFNYTMQNMPVPSGGTLPSIVVAPSNHDGFRMPDVEFQKNNFSFSDSVTFTPFPLSNSSVITNTVVPEYYISHTCSGSGSGETQKCYQFPIALHVNSLANAAFTFSIDAQNDPLGSTVPGANVISLFILQDTGTGGTPSPSSITPIPFFTITLNSSWQTYTVNSIFPGTAGLVLGQGGDDGLYLQVQMPLNLACKINFTAPSIYLGASTTVPANNYQSYDEVDSIINSPRTGDIRTSLNNFYFFGWLPMNDGVIALANPGALTYNVRANSDVWPLYNLIWQLAAPYSASGAGTTNPLSQMYNSSGGTVGYGPNVSSPTTAYSDFVANNQLSLSKMMGRVMIGSVPLSALLQATPTILGFKSVVTASSSSGVLFTTASSNVLNLFLGNIVTFTSTMALVNVIANAIYFVVPISGTTFHIATSFANALAGTVVGYTGPESGTVTAYLQQTASFEGEYTHTQLISELVSHHHTPPNPVDTFVITDAAGGASLGGPSGIGTTGATGNTGNGNPFNVTQPGTFYNVFIKL